MTPCLPLFLTWPGSAIPSLTNNAGGNWNQLKVGIIQLRAKAPLELALRWWGELGKCFFSHNPLFHIPPLSLEQLGLGWRLDLQVCPVCKIAVLTPSSDMPTHSWPISGFMLVLLTGSPKLMPVLQGMGSMPGLAVLEVLQQAEPYSQCVKTTGFPQSDWVFFLLPMNRNTSIRRAKGK